MVVQQYYEHASTEKAHPIPVTHKSEFRYETKTPMLIDVYRSNLIHMICSLSTTPGLQEPLTKSTSVKDGAPEKTEASRLMSASQPGILQSD